MFAWVSCPHYLGEILLYFGLVLLTRGRPIVCLIAVWVVSGRRGCSASHVDAVLLGVVAAAPGDACGGTRARCRCLPTQVINLVLAADATHRWYVEHFKTYPRGRRALVPFVF